MIRQPHTAEEKPLLVQYPSWTLKTLRNLKMDPGRIIAGNGFLRRGASTLLTGGTGIGKSVMVEQWAICLAAGLPLLGRIAVPKKCRVFYMGSQNDPETLKRDCASISAALGVKDTDVEDRLDMRYVPGLSSQMFYDFMGEIFSMKKKPDVLIVDPYQDFIGDASVNEDNKFFAWRRVVDKLITENNCAFITLPHTKKPSKRESLTDREQVSLASGTVAIGNWCRTACELTHQSSDVNYGLHFSKNAERTGLVNEGGSPLRDLYVEHSGDENAPWWKISQSQLPSVKINVEATVVKAAYANPQMSYREIQDLIGIPSSTVGRYYPKDLRKKKAEAEMKEKIAKESGGAPSGVREAPARCAPGYRGASPLHKNRGSK